MSKNTPECTCNPKKMASRGRCAVHGFRADPHVIMRRRIAKMSIHQLANEVLDLANDHVEHGSDGIGEPLYEGAEKTRLLILIGVARERLTGKPRKAPRAR